MARYDDYNYSSSSYLDYLYYFSLPTHLCFFVLILFFILGFTWYINYESIFEDMMNQLKLVVILSPLILLVVVHFMSSGFSILNPIFPGEQDSLHRAGGSPWGVAALLVFLLFMVSYQSSLQEKWFPLIAR